MKKLLTILLALTIVLGLAGCGADKTTPDKTPGTNVADDTPKPDIQPLEPEFMPALEIYRDILLGDVSGIEKTLPAEMWESIADEYGITKEDMVTQLADAYTSVGNIFQTAELKVVSFDFADDKIEDMEAILGSYGADLDITAAYEVNIEWTYEVSDEYKDQMDTTDTVDKWYAINIGNQWYILNEAYEWNILT